MKMTEQIHNFRPKRMIFQKTMCTKKCSPRAEFYRKFADQLIQGKIGGENFFLKMGHDGYQKIRLFT
jgi:hypothetical protein